MQVTSLLVDGQDMMQASASADGGSCGGSGESVEAIQANYEDLNQLLQNLSPAYQESFHASLASKLGALHSAQQWKYSSFHNS